MPGPVRVLWVGTEEAEIQRRAAELERRRDGLETGTAGTTDRALARLREEPGSFDCVVCEHGLQDGDVFALHAAVRDHDAAIPVIAFTGDRSLVVGDQDPMGPDETVADARPGERRPESNGESDPYDRLATRIEGVAGQTAAGDGDADALTVLRRHQRFLDVIPHPMYVLDDAGECVIANEALLEFLGLERGDVEGRDAATFIGTEEFEAASETLATTHRDGAEGAAVEFTIEAADGTVRHVEADVSVLTDGNGAYTASIGVLRDVTERVERERRLAQYQSFLETVPIGLLAIDPDGNIIWANEQMAQGFDGTVEDLVGERFRDLVDDGYFTSLTIEEYLDHVRHLLSSDNDDEKIVYELEWENKEGESVVTEVHMGLLPLEDGEFTGTVHAFRRITERKRYERELERQNERLEQFASFVSHDLRNPLNVGRGNLELLAEECECDTDALEDVRWSLDRMDELITDLLALAREGRTIGSRETIRLEQLVGEAWEGVETGPATLEVAGNATFQADGGRLRELFENLFRNAVEHGSTSPDSPPARQDAVEHGSTSPDSPSARQDAVEHGSTSPPSTSSQEDAIEHAGEGVTVTVGPIHGEDGTGGPEGASGPDDVPTGFYVEDDGCGIPSDQLGGPDAGRIFEVGYTTETEGTGFGLGIVREIAEAHGWTVTACESDDGGARFEIRGLTGRAAAGEGERAGS